MKPGILTLLLLAPFLELGAQSVVIPVPPVGVVPGAFGTRWEAELWIYNGNDFAIIVTQGPLREPSPRIIVPPKRSQQMPPFPLPDLLRSRAAFIGLDEFASLENVHFELGVRELTNRDAFRVELPVVSISDFSTRPLQLLNIPLDAKFRVALRLYVRFDTGSPAQLRLKLYDLDADEAALFERHVQIEPPASLPPVFVDSSVVWTMVTEIFQAALLEGNIRRARLEIIPDGPAGPRFWGFVSVTNNETQYVTTITP